MDDATIRIGGDSSGAGEALDQVGKKAQDLSGALKTIGVAAGAAWASLSATLGASVVAFSHTEESNQKLNAVIRATGGVAGVSSEEVKKLASALSDQTTFSKGAIKEGETILLTFTNIGKDVFPAATKATLDLATKMGIDAPSAAQMLGRALNDPTGAVGLLRREGIQLTKQQEEQIRVMQLSGNVSGAQKVILEALSRSIGGMAQSAAGGTGAFKQLANVTSSFGAEIGELLAPALIEAAKHLKDLLQYVKEHQEVVKLGAAVVVAAAGFTGLITGIAGTVYAAQKLSTAVSTVTTVVRALGMASKVAMGATGVGLLAIVAFEVYENWGRLWPAMQSIYRGFVAGIAELSKGVGNILKGVFTLDFQSFKTGLDQVTEALKKSVNEVSKTIGTRTTAAAKEAVQEGGKEINKETAKIIKDQQAQAAAFGRLQLAAERATNQAKLLEFQHASKALIALKQQEAATLKTLSDQSFKGERSAVAKHLAEVRLLYSREQDQDRKRHDKFQKDFQTSNTQFNKLNLMQQHEFLLKHGQQLQDSILTEESAMEEAADMMLQAQIQRNNARLVDQARFGAAYAAINAAMHSEVIEGSRKGFSQLEELANSSGNTLKTIGKGASAAMIVMKTAEGAISAYTGFVEAFGPYGIPPGIAAAAALTAYGLEQEAKVLRLSTGGIAMGGTPGRDSIPAMLKPNELVVPTTTFDDAVRAAGAISGKGGGGDSGPQTVEHVITFQGDAAKMLTLMNNRDKALGRYRGSS